MFKGITEIKHFVGDTFDARLKLYDISKLVDDPNQLEPWLTPLEKAELMSFKSKLKAKQRMATLALLAKDLGQPGLITRDDNGKPHVVLPETEITMSHCQDLVGYAVANKPIGMDIHHYSEKTTYVAKKFLSKEEINFCENHRQQPFMDLFWAVKESVYKVYGRHLPLKEIKIDLANIDSKQLSCDVNGKGDRVRVSYALHKTYCICLAELVNS